MAENIFPFEILQLYQAKQYNEAIRLVDEFNKLPQRLGGSFQTELQIIRASCLAETSRHAEAKVILNQILSTDPSNCFAWYAMGVMFYKSGDFRASIEPFDKAIGLNETAMHRAMEYRSKAASIVDLVNSGRVITEEALKILVFPLQFKANEDFKQNRLTKMVETLQLAGRIDPENKEIFQTIERIRNFFIIEVVKRLEDKAFGRVNLKYETAEKLISEYKEAGSLIKEISSELPRNSEQCFLIGFYNYMRGNIHNACEHFKEAIQMDSGCEKYKNYFKIANDTQQRLLEISRLWSSKDFLSALAEMERPEIDPKNLVVRQLMHFNRTNAFLSLNRAEQAREEFMKYRELIPIVGFDMMTHVLSGKSDGISEGNSK